MSSRSSPNRCRCGSATARRSAPPALVRMGGFACAPAASPPSIACGDGHGKQEARMSCDEKSPRIAGHCGPCSPATRNRYFRGKLLTVSDYQAEQRYMIARRRLTNRAMLGWGVVSGVALDRRGREVVACEEVALAGEHDQLWLARGKCGLEAVAPPKEAGDEGS